MGAVVFCNIAWMKNYRGITDEDQPYNGGSFVKENNDAMERINFLRWIYNLSATAPRQPN